MGYDAAVVSGAVVISLSCSAQWAGFGAFWGGLRRFTETRNERLGILGTGASDEGMRYTGSGCWLVWRLRTCMFFALCLGGAKYCPGAVARHVSQFRRRTPAHFASPPGQHGARTMPYPASACSPHIGLSATDSMAPRRRSVPPLSPAVYSRHTRLRAECQYWINPRCCYPPLAEHGWG